MAASWFLAVGLFIVTLGVGYLIWQVVAWAKGQRLRSVCLGLRCWRRDTRDVAAGSTWRCARPPGCS